MSRRVLTTQEARATVEQMVKVLESDVPALTERLVALSRRLTSDEMWSGGHAFRFLDTWEGVTSDLVRTRQAAYDLARHARQVNERIWAAGEGGAAGGVTGTAAGADAGTTPTDSRSEQPVAQEPLYRIYMVDGIGGRKGRKSEMLEELKRRLEERLGGRVEIVVLESAYINTSGSGIINWMKGLVKDSIEAVTARLDWQSATFNKLRKRIEDDLSRNPLGPGQKVMFIAYSGGGAVVDELVEYMEKVKKRDVGAVITLGSPLVDTEKILKYVEPENFKQITERDDPFGFFPDEKELIGWAAISAGMGPGALGANFMLHIIRQQLLESKVKIGEWLDDWPIGAHKKYGRSKEVVDIVEKIVKREGDLIDSFPKDAHPGDQYGLWA